VVSGRQIEALYLKAGQVSNECHENDPWNNKSLPGFLYGKLKMATESGHLGQNKPDYY